MKRTILFCSLIALGALSALIASHPETPTVKAAPVSSSCQCGKPGVSAVIDPATDEPKQWFCNRCHGRLMLP